MLLPGSLCVSRARETTPAWLRLLQSAEDCLDMILDLPYDSKAWNDLVSKALQRSTHGRTTRVTSPQFAMVWTASFSESSRVIFLVCNLSCSVCVLTCIVGGFKFAIIYRLFGKSVCQRVVNWVGSYHLYVSSVFVSTCVCDCVATYRAVPYRDAQAYHSASRLALVHRSVH